MGKLADLLSQIEGAKSAIKQQATDFSQGFNSGAVAGFPGWAGDMAYLADTARLALTGERTQAPPSEYVGTTDYIASKAGYPIPGSVSGQLGAALGGMLSPGPGDLGRLGSVLSAIPFWHGSPHKFDRFDLSRMGTGEGAQAYGWGAYGAESPSTASTYTGGAGDIYGMTVQRGVGDYHAAAFSHSNPKYSTDAHFPTQEEADQWVRQQQGGNLYRGEYAWPDPAKEAATPLTGEDLLQWDRPLMEQSPDIQRAALSDIDEAIRLTQKALETASERRRPSTEADLARLIRERNGMLAQTGEGIYRSKQSQNITIGSRDDISAAQQAASEHFRALGIPGIRYLDGMSRGDGAGTFNYVMFDDNGIRLLERNGQPINQFSPPQNNAMVR